MALTTAQKILFDDLTQQWEADQRQSGNGGMFPLYTLAFATNAQVKAVMLTYVTAKKAALQATVTALTAARAAQDAQLTQQIADCDAIITELG